MIWGVSLPLFRSNTEYGWPSNSAETVIVTHTYNATRSRGNELDNKVSIPWRTKDEGIYLVFDYNLAAFLDEADCYYSNSRSPRDIPSVNAHKYLRTWAQMVKLSPSMDR